MPKKRPPLQSSAGTDTEPVSDAQVATRDLTQTPIQPATKRFRVVAALFGIWLVFLIYLASLTWSGK